MGVIEKIRESNLAFVKNENFSGVKKVIVDNYSDQAHFIYELLQNADDVSATEIRFILEKERMIVRHNGKPFTEDNVRAICSISKGTKSDDYTKIGRFGIGFKSVFAYTNNPHVYCRNYNFEIEDLVLPRRRRRTVEMDKKETVFVLLFNNKKTKDVAYEQIFEKLQEVSTDALLFLSHIQTIAIETDGRERLISRSVSQTKKFRKDTVFEEIEISISLDGALQSARSYYLFRKNNISLTDIDENGKPVKVENQSVMIAFFKNLDRPCPFSEVGDFLNGRDGENCLYVFFPTMIRTNFEYLIHAPFVTKSSRDTIAQNNAANKHLMEQIGILAADSLLVFSKMHSDWMKSLISKLFFDHYNEGIIFDSFKQELIQLLKRGESLIPCDDEKWYPYAAVAFSTEKPERVQEIQRLFGKDFLAEFCKIKKSETGTYSVGEADTYFKFLNAQFRLKCWTTEEILPTLDAAFFQQKSSKWFIQFIDIIVETNGFYQKSFTANYKDLDKLPLIRLANGKHVTVEQKQNVYLNNGTLDESVLTSPKVEYLYKEIFHIREYSVERGEADLALATIQKRGDKISFVKHLELVRAVVLAVKAEKMKKDELEDQRFLFAINCKTKERKLVSPKESRINKWERHNHTTDMNVLLSGVDVFVLDKRYTEAFSIAELRQVGCIEGLSPIDYSSSSTDYEHYRNYKKLIGLSYEDNSGYFIYLRVHPREALNRQFKPFFHIEYLEEILAQKTNIKKSVEILRLVRDYESQIKDIVEWSSNQNYSSSGKVYGSGEKYSAFGLSLKSASWLCNRAYHPCRPDQITEKNLPDEYRKLGGPAINFLKRLGLKEDHEEEMRKLNEDLKKKGMFVIPLAEQQEFAEFQRAKAEKKAKEEERKRKEEQKKKEPNSSENGSSLPVSTVVQDILDRKKNKTSGKKTDRQRTERNTEETATGTFDYETHRRKQPETQIDEDEYLPRSVDYAKILEKAIQDSAEELERLEKIDALQKRLSESEKYSYGWFTTLLEMELEAAVTSNSDNHEISITFSKVELEPDSKRTLLLKNPSRFIPQFVEELSDIPLILKYEDQTRKVVIEAASVSSYTLRVKLREDINHDELNISGIKEAYLEAQSPAFLMQELQKQFLQLNYEDTYSMRDNLCENIEFVFGPPGTGKTTHLAKNVILPLVQQKEPARILVLTPTNKASDVLVRRIMSLCDPKDSFDWLIRFGGTNDEVIEEQGILKAKETDVRKMPHSVSVTTIARFAYDYFMPDKERLYLYAINWDYIIIDEASMIPLANILYPLYKKAPKQFIIAGDPFQIEPITAVELWKRENIYTMVGLESFSNSRTVPHDYKVTKLMTQYRSLPEIGNIFSRFAYDGLLKHYRSSDSRTMLNLEQDFSPLNIIKFPVSKYESIYCAKRLQKRSAYQVYSALFSFEFARYLADQLETANPGKCFRIGIIAPYRAESDIIQKLVATEIHTKNVDVQVGTIHGFQGDECDIIIAVFNTPPYISSSPDMFLNKMNIINVSISRAKDYMFVIMPDDQAENIQNLCLVKRVEKLFLDEGCSIIQAEDMEQQMFGEKKYIEENSFSTGHQDVNVYGLPEKRYEVRTEEGAVDIQVHKVLA